MGHRAGESYIRSWQMEPLPVAVIAGLTPNDVEVSFYDDRTETIPYEETTDAVVMSVETYTAKRAYQIASDYRRRGIPVIMGGFHPTLVPQEAERYAEAIVIGEAEGVWMRVIDDLRHGTLQKRYQSDVRPLLQRNFIDRTIFEGKSYLPIRLIESGRGCRFPCTFCAIQSFFERTYRARAFENVVEEILSLKDSTKLFFFIDDNFAADIEAAKDLLRALIPLNIRWVTQMSINAAHDEEFLQLLVLSGCKLVLIGFESMEEKNLRQMRKSFNTMNGGYLRALANLHRHKIGVYGTFVFGFDHDTSQSFDNALRFAIEQNLYIAAFNHLTPFPGTPLYDQLKGEERLRFDAWWMDDAYRYNDVPFHAASIPHAEITERCVNARRQFYSWRSIAKRGVSRIVRSDGFMFRTFFPVNFMHGREINTRNGFPLGDERWIGPLIEVTR